MHLQNEILSIYYACLVAYFGFQKDFFYQNKTRFSFHVEAWGDCYIK